MATIALKANERKVFGKKVKNLRAHGEIPAILYGKKAENKNLSLNGNEFEKVLNSAGTSTLVDLEIGKDEKTKILIHEPQRDPVTDKILHVDLYKVDMKQEIHTEIPLKFEGVSAAVEELEGNLITGKDALEIECLPENLVSEIKVDIALLKTFEDLIKVNDLNIPQGIKVLDDPEEIIAQVTPPRSDEELQEMETEAAADTEKSQIENIEAEAEKERAEKAEVVEEGEAAPEKSAEKE